MPWRKVISFQLLEGIIIFCLVFSLSLRASFAENIRLEITGAEVVKIPVAIPDFEGPLVLTKSLSEVARRDLRIQLIFNVLGENFSSKDALLFSALGVSYVITGKIIESDGYVRTEFYLYDAIAREKLLARAYRGPEVAARYMVHRFLDVAVKKITDVQGVAFSRVAYVRRTQKGDQLFVVDFDGFHPTLVATRQEGLILYPRFSPDGKKIAFVSYRHGRPEIHLLDLTTGKRKILCKYPGLNASPVWHPSGKKLVVTLSKDGGVDLYLIDLSGRVLKRLTNGLGINTGGSFSPDGRYLAFVSDRGGSPQIYILDMLTGSIRRLTFHGSYNTSPSWSPRGDRIVYAGVVNGKFQLFTIDPHGGEPIRITNKGSFEAPVFSPNGRLILCQGKSDLGQGLFLMLSNGAAQTLYIKGQRLLFPDWTRIK